MVSGQNAWQQPSKQILNALVTTMEAPPRAIETPVPRKVTFDVMRTFRDAWNPLHMPEADTVKAVVQYLVRLDDKWQLSDKKNQVRLRTVPVKEKPMTAPLADQRPGRGHFYGCGGGGGRPQR